MKYAPKKMFVLENGKYVEITYEEHTYRKETDEQYAERRFIPVQGYLIETDQQCYTEFYREVERRKYLQKLEIELNPLSLESLDKEENNGIDFIEAENTDIAEQVENKLMIEKLLKVLPMLSEEELLLIHRFYYEEIPETKLAGIYGITQQAISKRLIKIEGKLKKLLET